MVLCSECDLTEATAPDKQIRLLPLGTLVELPAVIFPHHTSGYDTH